MDSKEPTVYLNGEFVHRSEARISVFDQGLIFGDGVFDTLLAANGYAFKLDGHLDRLFRSAKAVKIDIPHDKAQMKALTIETIRRNDLRDAYVKIIVTRGVGPKPLLGRGDAAKPTTIIFAVPPLSVVPEEKIRTGAKLISTTIKRAPAESLDPRIKSLNYQPNVLMRLEALDAGCDEAISYGYDGYVAEGGAENIWVVKDEWLMTPGHGVLEGLTRETVLEIATSLGYAAEMRNLRRYDLSQADEVFLCSTAGGIIPVSEIDHVRVGRGEPGRITMQVREKYLEMLRNGVHGTPIF